MKKSPVLAVLIALIIFLLAQFISKTIVQFVSDPVVWLNQVLLKVTLLILSFLAIKYLLNISLSEAGFKKPDMKMKKWSVSFSGMVLGAISTMLIFFTSAEGVPLAKNLNILEFLLIIVIWSSFVEEVFIRGLIQPYLKPFEHKKRVFFNFQFSIPVLTCALIFSGMHLSLLFAGADYLTVVFTMLLTFILGLLAGVYREKYDSIIPSIITHMSFNIGGIIAGIVITILIRIITGELPPH